MNGHQPARPERCQHCHGENPVQRNPDPTDNTRVPSAMSVSTNSFYSPSSQAHGIQQHLPPSTERLRQNSLVLRSGQNNRVRSPLNVLRAEVTFYLHEKSLQDDTRELLSDNITLIGELV